MHVQSHSRMGAQWTLRAIGNVRMPLPCHPRQQILELRTVLRPASQQVIAIVWATWIVPLSRPRR